MQIQNGVVNMSTTIIIKQFTWRAHGEMCSVARRYAKIVCCASFAASRCCITLHSISQHEQIKSDEIKWNLLHRKANFFRLMGCRRRRCCCCQLQPLQPMQIHPNCELYSSDRNHWIRVVFCRTIRIFLNEIWCAHTKSQSFIQGQQDEYHKNIINIFFSAVISMRIRFQRVPQQFLSIHVLTTLVDEHRRASVYATCTYT